MLTYRTNVLLTEHEAVILAKLAKQKKVSKNQILRDAFQKTYKITEVDKKMTNNEAFLKMKKLLAKTKMTAQDFIDYKHDGHKY